MFGTTVMMSKEESDSITEEAMAGAQSLMEEEAEQLASEKAEIKAQELERFTPTEITKCVDTNLETASFDYYSGIAYTKEKNLKQTIEFSDVRKGTHFIVMCGCVMVKVESTDFPNITRRSF